MWIPTSAAQLVSAIAEKTLPYESADFEVKAQLPDSKKNSDIAVDVAAMATDGGVIVYGVIEDKKAVTFTQNAISLEGVKDRISDIVMSNVREDVQFDVRLLPLDDDPSMGFVVIEVPASIRAPHMVESKDQYRFYGRVPGGNQLLSEAQVARLYERRQVVEEEAGVALDSAIGVAPVEEAPGDRGDIHIVVRPLLSDDELRDRALDGKDLDRINLAIRQASAAFRFTEPAEPTVGSLVSGQLNGRQTIDGYLVINPPFIGQGGEKDVVRYCGSIEVLDDGTVRYFHAAIAEHYPKDGIERFVLYDGAVAQSVAQVAHLAAGLLEEGGYNGAVDVSLGLVNVADSGSSYWYHRHGGVFPVANFPTYPYDIYRTTTRVMSAQLRAEAVSIADRLVRKLLRATRPPGTPDPLALA